MPSEKTIIRIEVICEGKEFTFETHPYSHPNLMAFISDKLYPDNFGECKGIGRCGTCHIHVLSPIFDLARDDGNEKSTLRKIPFCQSNSRLACQMVVDRRLNGLRIAVISDNDYQK